MRTSGLIGAIALLWMGCVDAVDEEQSVEPLQTAPFFGGDPANHALFASDVSFWETPLAQSEMDCMWDSGVRHIIVGTQVDWIAREQLAMAVARGMTVDAYVYLYWDKDIAAQVEAAFAMTQGFPIGRMWLDIEQDPAGLGSNSLIPKIQQSLATCQAKPGVDCGIYTGPGWWKTYLANTSTFTGVPLWYALYNKKRTLSDWTVEKFGGWASPVAKQFQTAPLCGVGGADWNVMQVATTPSVTVDRSPPPDTHAVPVAPANLFPASGAVIPIEYAKIMSGTVPRATLYDLALERYLNGAWKPYYTWTNANAFVKASPPATAGLYRFRVRAKNSYGWGAWSDYATFDYGHYTGPRPSSAPSTPPPSTPPPTTSVPGGLAPDGGVTIANSGVTLTCGAVTSSTSYQFAVESGSGSAWTPYFTYTTVGTTRTFYPQTRGIDFRFRVRAMVGGAYGAWSPYATFHVQ